jgi:ABC-2 type transport system ATP-binding protein
MPAAIELRQLSKQYGDLAAVSDLNLTVAPGEVLGFLGPNGAGKTTTIRLMTGFLRPTGGIVNLLGHDMATAAGSLAARRRLGYVPDVAGLDATATGRWLLDDLARLQGAPPVDRNALIAALELDERDLRRPMGRLSRGTRQKVNIVQGLQHRPDLLILEEPTEGLDPLAKRALFTLLREAQSRGATLFFSSHILSEVEELCDRVALIRRGRLVAVDEIVALRATLQRRVDLLLSEPVPGMAARLATLPGASQISERDGRWQFTAADLPALLRLLAELPVLDVAIEPPSLADVFMRYYEPEATNA